MYALENRGKLKPTYSGEAIIYEVIRENQRCRVTFNGVPWRAESLVPFTFCLGDSVKVIGREGSFLLIETFFARGTEKRR